MVRFFVDFDFDVNEQSILTHGSETTHVLYFFFELTYSTFGQKLDPNSSCVTFHCVLET